MRLLPVALLAVLLAVPPHVRSADPPVPKEKDKRPSVDDLVMDLGNPAFAAREKAQRELWLRGAGAVPALERAAKSDDPEAARRARAILDRFGWGDLPDTPPAVLQLIRKFQAGDSNPARSDAVRKEAIAELLELGRPGVSAVRSILKKDIPADSRARLIASVTALVRREVPLLLLAGKLAEADELISLHAAGTTADGAADFAAYHVLRGDLPVAIAQAEAAVKGREGEAARLVLVYLYRAAGLWAKARGAADELPVEPEAASFKEILLEEEGNWAALADLSPGRELNHPDAVRLTLMRLAGRKEKFDLALKKVRADADELNDPYDLMDAAVTLLTNNRAADAADLLARKKSNLGLLSEIQIARMKYQEALDLIGEEKDAIPPAERLEFNLRRARVLMAAGKRDEAVKLFEEVARGVLTSDPNNNRILSRPARSLIRTEVRVGLRDLACEHAAQLVPLNAPAGSTTSGESVFELLFPLDPIVAETLFLLLRQSRIPGDQPGASMIRTRDLLNGTAGAAAVDQAAKLLRESAALTAPAAPLLKARRLFALAMVYRAARRTEDAETAFKFAAELTSASDGAATAIGARSWVYGSPDPARVWIEWGDYLTEQNRHREAAAVLETGWKLFPDQPLPMLLWGRALTASGDAKEGARRAELSHWVSLGNEKVRGRFLDELARRGEGKAIRREVGLISKACWSQSHMFGNVMNQCARGCALVKDFATAEVCGQRSLLVVMRKPGIYFVDTAGYLNVPHEILVFRARALLSAGKFDEALEAAREVLSITPGYLDLVTGMVPELDRLGRNKDADALFELAWAAYEKVLKDFPESASARAALAQLSGQCNRKLGAGVKYAKEAVASDPAAPGYREWLAEVLFRRNARPDAIKVMQKLHDENPRTFLYKRQLVRYRTSPLDSPWPYTAE